VDLASAFWHLELDEESSKLTTFSTLYGRFRWLRLPFGLNVSSEIFQIRLNQELLGLEGVRCIAYDILVYGTNEKDHDQNFERLLERCKEKSIKLTKDKLEFKCKEVAGDEKASLLTAIRLIQSDDINVRSNNNESQVWTRIESKTQLGKTKNQTPSRRINQASNQILEPNQYASLAVDESNENKDMDHNVTPSSTHIENSTNSGRRIQHQKEKQRYSVEPTQQHNASSSKSTEGLIAILGDSMLKKLSPSRLRRSTGKKIIVKTFPGATTSDMKHYIKPTLEKNRSPTSRDPRWNK
ncbi:Hypothetical predicted protein, partial [Paramuricea clavata]